MVASAPQSTWAMNRIMRVLMPERRDALMLISCLQRAKGPDGGQFGRR
jgi:hypothetical protein